MKKLKCILFCCFYFLINVSFSANINEYKKLQDSLRHEVESSRINKNSLGLIVTSESGQMIFQLNSDNKFAPASLTKIITAAAVMEELPTGHQFMTALKADKSLIKKNTLSGDLYLIGGGDAGFVSESMWFLVNEFVRSGITEIKGNIIVDDSRFDSIRFDESRDQARVDRAYDSPVGAMTFNWSAVNIYVRPANTSGHPAQVFIDPENNYIKITNKAKTVKSGKTKISVSHKGLSKDKKNETIEVSGAISIGAAEFVAYKSVIQPEIWAGENLKSFLLQRGISVDGEVKSGLVISRADTIAFHKSKPLGELASGMLKFSNNYIAEILTKNLAAESGVKKASLSAGIEQISGYLKKKGFSDFVLVNPSGLSRNNQFKPIDILNVLRHMQSNFKVFPEYLAGMPISGVDGTLKRRLSLYEGRVRAKTGHLSGVSGLGGYLSTKGSHIYPFVFMHNGEVNESYKAKALFDSLLEILLKSDK